MGQYALPGEILLKGSYSHYYLHGLVAPFDTLVLRIMLGCSSKRG